MSGALTFAAVESGELRRIIDRAADTLAGAASAAEILDARDQAAFAYDAAKASARLAKAKGAHDELIARAYRAQADAAEIEFLAKKRLADEYEAAQERGEVAGHGGARGNQHTAKVDAGNLGEKPVTVAEIGLTRPQIFEARQIRDAIEREPGIVRRVLNDILDAGDEPTKARLRKELAPAISKVRSAATAEKKERRVAREIALAGKIEALPEKRYGVILADPEWRFEPYSRDSGMDRAPDNHYPTSPTAQIATRDVASIAADDCVLFLWATAPMLPDALSVLTAWGFTYRTHAVWHKQRTGKGRGTGYWFLGEHELLLVGVKGDIPAPAPGTQWRSVFAAHVGDHSAKPEISLELIEAYFPNVPKIELNRRGPARPGWDAWGAEAETAAAESDGFPVAALAAADRPEADAVTEAIVAAGLAPSKYWLAINSGLENNRPCSLPSRLFRYPVEFIQARTPETQSRLALRHPELWNAADVVPFLEDIVTKTGISVEWHGPEELGHDISKRYRSFHAVDLCTDKHWKDLLATERFTSRESIFRAVRINLEGKELSVKHARAIMVALEAAEPEGRSVEGLLGKGLWPFQDGKRKYIAPNIGLEGAASAWLTIHGIEDGWLAYVGGCLSVTAEGMERRAGKKDADVPLPLADEVESKEPEPARIEEWVRPKGKHTCGRDPAAGPGTCHHWWDGCPKAEKRGCYLLWKKQEAAMATASDGDAVGCRPQDDAPRLPPPPGSSPIELAIGDMGDYGSARLSVSREPDGQFLVWVYYEIVGLCSASVPVEGTFSDYPNALRMGLRVLRRALETISGIGVCADQQRAAARSGLAWIDARLAKWKLADDAESEAA